MSKRRRIMEESLASAISNIGVPAALAFYITFRVNVSLERLVEAINDLKITIHTSLASKKAAQ